MERWNAYFSGQVQGVGFRYSTQKIAGQYRVYGFVRNLDDGRVELVAEGEIADLDGFLGHIGTVMQDHIENTVIDRCPATGEFPRFEVRM